MDWSEILTESEGVYMTRLLRRLKAASWAAPLLSSIAERGGVTYRNKPLLLEARVGNELNRAHVPALEYEVPTGVAGTTVDFRFGRRPIWLVEVVSIGRSEALEAATHRAGSVYGTFLSSPHQLQSEEEQRQSEEGESLLVIQKIGEKVHDGMRPIKFPMPVPNTYGIVVVDMRGHLGGGDIHDWRQIAYGTEFAAPQYQKYWLDKNGRRMPVRGVWHPQNPMRFARTARERLHAILFVAEKHYKSGSLTEKCWLCFNPHLIATEAEGRELAATFPLRPRARAKRRT
jgi:hypothetical protein